MPWARNLGERAGTLQAAVAELGATEGIELVRVSDTAVTKPVGGPAGQPDFLNLVLRIDTVLAPLDLLAACQPNRGGRTTAPARSAGARAPWTWT